MIPSILEKSRQKIATVCRNYNVKELRLFGSQVRGDFSAESDFDFLIDFAPKQKLDLSRLAKLKRNCLKSSGNKLT